MNTSQSISTSPAVIRFARAIHNRMDEQCPATQDAIDRIVAGEGFRGRDGILESLPHLTRLQLLASVQSAWNDGDLKLATGFSRDYWLGFIEGEARS